MLADVKHNCNSLWHDNGPVVMEEWLLLGNKY